MVINALLMNEIDNVVTCVEMVQAGQEVVYQRGEEVCSVVAEDIIPYCHKVSLADLGKGDEVIKYGELLGKTSTFIARGHLVDHNNLYSVPRNYENEFIK